MTQMTDSLTKLKLCSLGVATNNWTEASALYLELLLAEEAGIINILCVGDSKLFINNEHYE